MEFYDPAAALAPAGLHNTGAICHFNALLQCLLSCTALVRTVLRSKKTLGETRTGQALYALVQAAASGSAAAQSGSAALLQALVSDLRARRPRFAFGNSQESASEGLVLLLDMLEPAGGRSPLSHLFYHRYRQSAVCASCGEQDTQHDVAVQLNMFGIDRCPPRTPEAFAAHILEHREEVDEYSCPSCGAKAPGAREYRLRMLPELLVCVFNLYTARGAVRYYPQLMTFPGADGQALTYAQVAQAEHSGALGGGHYVARGFRRGAGGGLSCHLFNDSSASPAPLQSNSRVYMVFYHAVRTREK